MEEFRRVTVTPYNEVYEVSNEGRVHSLGHWLNNNGTMVWHEGRELNGHFNEYRRNEQTVALCYNGVKKWFRVHHLVAWAFPEICGEWFEGAEVDHLDGDPTNNVATNLRVTDRKGNMSNPNTRKKLEVFWRSEKFRTAQSERMKGEKNPIHRCMTEEWYRKLYTKEKGWHHTEESKKKMSEKVSKRLADAEKLPRAKTVGYYDENGNIVKFRSTREAERLTGVNRQRIMTSIKKSTLCKEGIQWILF